MEAGLFVMMAGSGLLFLLLSFKFGALLKALSAVMFFSAALVLMAGYEVAYTSEFVDGAKCKASDPCIQQHFLIREDPTTGETNGVFIAWLFVVLGIFSAMLFIIEMMP